MTDAERRALRASFGAFATGVTVVTTRDAQGRPRGFTANSFTSVSLDPPLLLVCPAKGAYSYQSFLEAPHFAVNILAEDQKELSGLFASRSPEKFAQADWAPGPEGVPLLAGTLAHFVCAREQAVDAGDHAVLIGRVLAHGAREGQPLGYFRGEYFTLSLDAPLVAAVAEGAGVRIGAVMDAGSSVLLAEGPEGALSLPYAPQAATGRAGLEAHLRRAGLRVHLGHLYAVYRDSATGTHVIYYHGTVEGAAPPGMAFHPIDALPLERVGDPAERSMLTRYRREYRHGAFGIYHGDEVAGVVHSVSAPSPSPDPSPNPSAATGPNDAPE